MSKSGPLFHEQLGTGGPTLVFLPGLGGTTRYWQPRVAPLARSHRLILVDPLGFGRSPKPWGPYLVERHVAELHGVLGDAGPVTLVGHSFGAVLAVAYATRYTNQVRRLVLLGLPYFGSEQRALDHFRTFPVPVRWFATNMFLAALGCILTRRLLGKLLPLVIRNMPREVVQDLARHTWRSFTSTLWEGVFRYDLARDADRLPADLPVLCVHGLADRTAPLHGLHRLAQGRPGWQVLLLPGVDHHPLLRNADFCLQLLASNSAASHAADSGLVRGRWKVR